MEAIKEGGAAAFIKGVLADAEKDQRAMEDRHREGLARAVANFEAFVEAARVCPILAETKDEFRPTKSFDNGKAASDEEAYFGDAFGFHVKALAKVSAAHFKKTMDRPISQEDVYAIVMQTTEVFLGWMMAYTGNAPTRPGTIL